MKKRVSVTRYVAGFMTVLFLLMGSGAFAEEIKIAGGGGPVDNVLKPVKDAFEKATGIKLTIISAGATIAFRDLTKGGLDASAAGFSYDELLQAEKKEGFEVPDPAAYKGFEVAKAGIAVLANKDNGVAKLSKDQLKGIFTGKIQNWKEVGGSDAPILVVIAKLNPATNATFKKIALDGEDFIKDVADTNTTDDLKQFIAQSAESVGFGPTTAAGGAVKAIDSIEISRVISIITKGTPSPKVQKLLDFIKGEGQKYVKK